MNPNTESGVANAALFTVEVAWLVDVDPVDVVVFVEDLLRETEMLIPLPLPL